MQSPASQPNWPSRVSKGLPQCLEMVGWWWGEGVALALADPPRNGSHFRQSSKLSSTPNTPLPQPCTYPCTCLYF